MVAFFSRSLFFSICKVENTPNLNGMVTCVDAIPEYFSTIRTNFLRAWKIGVSLFRQWRGVIRRPCLYLIFENVFCRWRCLVVKFQERRWRTKLQQVLLWWGVFIAAKTGSTFVLVWKLSSKSVVLFVFFFFFGWISLVKIYLLTLHRPRMSRWRTTVVSFEHRGRRHGVLRCVK